VRVARLRALGMPIPQIASHIASGEPRVSLSNALRALADEVDGDIERLAATRDRLRELARSQAYGQPVEALAQALRERQLLGTDAALPADEASAASLLDALHPDGMPGVLAQATSLLDDPDARLRLNTLLERFHAFADDASESEIDNLARDVASTLPRPEQAATPVDIELMDKLLGHRFNAAQRRLMHLLRHKLTTDDE